MVHPEVSGFHEIQVQMNPEKGEEYDLFIGRFKSDQKYHLLGYRPVSCRAYFSANSESNGDHGIVQLPEGKEKLSQLEKGEIFSVKTEKGTTWNIKYLGS